ncbi:MAG: UvrD-helicase domain-containing protein [Candidatus Omnitrophota bacterium]
MNLKKGEVRKDSILSFPHIYVIEASAGSGKTRTLAGRYVDFLLHYSAQGSIPFSFRNIIAMTFTNEAADQMKQEIFLMLKSKALGRDSESSCATHIIDEIINNFSDFAVRTIDSFVHSLLISSSMELKLPPDYEITAQPQPCLEYVLDNFLDEAVSDHDTEQLFLGFLNHFLVIEGQKHWNPKKMLLNLLIRFYREENARAKLFKGIADDLDLSQEERKLKSGIKGFLSVLTVLPDLNQRFIRGLSLTLNNSGPAFLKSLSAYIGKSFMPGEGILNKDASLPGSDLNRSWMGLKEQYDTYARAFVWLRYNFYIKILGRFRQRLEDFKKEKRIVFLDELNKKARQFLTSEGLLPAEIYYKLSLVLYHYLIDEFQDTSILQWENIQALVEDALSKGGSLFYVGDKKQAIFRFRGGEVELFELIKSRFKNQVVKIHDEVLLRNYRSGRVIVEFNNDVFSQANLRMFLSGFSLLTSEFQDKILGVFKDSQQESARQNHPGGYVRLEIAQGDNKQQAQEFLNIKLKETIIGLRERFNYQDILILVRDNQEAEEIAGFLLEEGVPVCASRTISIRRNYIIRQIIALLKFLNSPIDNLSFASFILGDVFTKATRLSSRKLRLWLENARVNKEEGILYTRFRAEFSDAWEEYLQYLFNAVGFLSVYDLVETILIKFSIEEAFPHLTGFTRRLLEILNDLQEQGKNSLADFLEWFENTQEEELFVRLPAGLDAIKILTIHKAKGLSSPVVIFPYVALEIKVGEVAFESPKIVHETTEGLYLLYFQKEICQRHPELNLIYQREYYQGLLDELNCCYVGFTRAASELYIFLPQKINRSNNPLIPLLFGQEQNLKEFGSKSAYPLRAKPLADIRRKEAAGNKTLPQELFRKILYGQLIPPEQVFPAGKRFSANRGELLHYLLAEISPGIFLKDPSSYIQRVKDACRLFNYSDHQEIRQSLCDFFRDPKMQEFFSPDFEAFSEKEIVDRCGNLKRIDRLLVSEDKVLIIDYKTAEGYHSSHQEQIKEYADLIKELYPCRALEGWLIYIDSKKAQRVNLK